MISLDNLIIVVICKFIKIGINRVVGDGLGHQAKVPIKPPCIDYHIRAGKHQFFSPAKLFNADFRSLAVVFVFGSEPRSLITPSKLLLISS